MADSHGDAHAIAAGLERLDHAGCGTVFHLGDICDSAAPETAAACVRRLAVAGAMAVRGNNDHALLAGGGALDPLTRTYLEGLPLAIDTPAALFTHSRPQVDALGFAALIGDLDEDQAVLFLRTFPGRLLFRGHGHHPSLRRLRGAAAPLRDLNARAPVQSVRDGAVVTCGSVAQGTVLVWDPLSARIALTPL